MAKEYLMPKLAMAMNEGTINQWVVGHGEKVQKEAPLASIETEKTAYEVCSPLDGYLCIIKQAGETVDCDSLIAWFCESPEEVEALASGGQSDTKEAATNGAVETQESAIAAPAPTPVPLGDLNQRVIASPLAKKMAEDKNLDLRLVVGTGPNGRIVKRDVLQALEHGVHTRSAAPQSARRELARIPITGMRKVIADRMIQSLQTTAQLTSGWESDITRLLEVRAKFVERQESLGTKVSVNAFLIKAITYAIRQVPVVNSCQDGSDVVIYDNINMGIAMSMRGATEYDSGLMVAVLHNVERMGVVEIDKEMKALFERVRNGTGTPEDTSGSTITLSSTAGLAPPGMTTTPILNQPNAALLGLSTPIERPAAYNGEIALRTLLPLSFTFDHRLLDGEPAARFMSALHDALENPELMLG